MEQIINLISNNIVLSNQELQLLQQTFTLLIMIPIVTTVAGIFRYMIGLRSLSTYAPIVLTFAFYDLGRNQVGFDSIISKSEFSKGTLLGLILYIVVFLSTLLLYWFFRRLRIHYIPKTSIVFTGVALSIIVLVLGVTAIAERKVFIYLNVISIILIIILSERFLSQLSRKGIKNTFFVGLETLIISITAYLILTREIVSKAIEESFLPLIVFLITLNLFVGTFLGLRLNEYWRFRSLIFKDYGGKNVKSGTDKKK